ncbi:hypothetical protein [Paraburkholderia aspalathi]|uniref:hypothetical protein n=1 Tax=Paraburkholderia aspalathi TaxID=1324617 RepID=UPI0038BD8640
MISLYVPDDDLKAQFINAQVRTPGVSGREPTYSAAYIELIYTFYRLSGWGMRQTTGCMEDFWATPVIPPPAHAVVQGNADTRWHDQITAYIKEKGIYAFQKKYGYGLRSLVEA